MNPVGSEKPVLVRLFGLPILIVLLGVLAACDPPPGDGIIRLSNESSEAIGVVNLHYHQGEVPTIEELARGEEWVFHHDAGESGYFMDTYLQAEGEETFCVEDEVLLILRPLDGHTFESDPLSPSDASNFEIVEQYGPDFCVQSEEHIITYDG